MKDVDRAAWLDGARMLDLALRGPRPPAGLDGIGAHLSDWSGRDRDLRKAAAGWWRSVVPLLRPLAAGLRERQGRSRRCRRCWRRCANAPLALSGDAVWAGPAGRAAADLFAAVEPAAEHGPERDRSRQPADPPRAADGRRGSASALRPASADLHLGPARGAAPACRPDDSRRPQRGQLARSARARSLAGAAHPRRARPAEPGAADRPFRARFRRGAGRPAGARHPRPPRRSRAGHRLALLAAAGGDDRRPHPRAPSPPLGAGDRPARSPRSRRAARRRARPSSSARAGSR